jgi:hypothetical protein
MPEECVICESALEGGPLYCGRCGFPTALTSAAVIALGREGLGDANGEAVVEEAVEAGAESEIPADPEEAAIAHFARELRRALELIRELGGESGDVLGELRQAALLQAEGRATDTLALLRNAQVTASTRVGELFEHRLEELEDRQQVLVSQGILPEILGEAIRLREEFAEAPLESVLYHLADADRRLARTESNWAELRAMLRQIDQIRLGSKKVGLEFPEVEERLAGLRKSLAGGALTAEELETSLRTTTEGLHFYHDALTRPLQEELDRHAAHLAQYRPDHPPSRRARQMHTEANRHLRNGRFAEATFRLAELREAIREAASPPAVEPPAGPLADRPAPAAASAPTETRYELAPLLAQAREIAGRLKQLPPEDPKTREAAAQIRVATDHLRARRLPEAGRTLTELMRSLDRNGPRRGG